MFSCKLLPHTGSTWTTLSSLLAPSRTYHPLNPTGSWSLILSHPVHAAIARRLLVAYIQQYDEGLCAWPYHTCFSLVGGSGGREA